MAWVTVLRASHHYVLKQTDTQPGREARGVNAPKPNARNFLGPGRGLNSSNSAPSGRLILWRGWCWLVLAWATSQFLPPPGTPGLVRQGFQDCGCQVEGSLVRHQHSAHNLGKILQSGREWSKNVFVFGKFDGSLQIPFCGAAFKPTLSDEGWLTICLG